MSGTNGQGAGDGEAVGADASEEEKSERPVSEAPASEPDATTSEDTTSKLKEKLLRTAADFDNFRKRTKRDVEEAERRGREEILKDLLPIMDNLERAVSAADSAKDIEAVAEGVRMVLKQFEDIGSRIGIERVPTIGARFDPMVHDAVQQMETDEHPPGTIMKEVVPGYRMSGKLVRAALVVVARPPSPPEAEAEAVEEEEDSEGEG